MATSDTLGRTAPDSSGRTAFLVVDTESIPDGRLLSMVKYRDLGLTPEEAIERARSEARDASYTNSDFLPYTFQIPVGVCVVRVAQDFSLQAIRCLDYPLFRPREIVEQFWKGVGHYSQAKVVTFNGRSFDLPLLEMAAFRYGVSAQSYILKGRNQFHGDLDLMDWMGNYGACRIVGGLDLLAKLIGKPGKMDVSGDKVYEMYHAGQLREINDYCLCDTLDTYFVFLRTRVLTGDVTREAEVELVERARKALAGQVGEFPILKQYLDGWTDGTAWP